MEPKWVEAPEMILEPKGAVNQGIVLGHRADFEPDAIQAMQVVQGGISGDIIVIIPNETAAQCRQVGGEGYYQKEDLWKNRMSNEFFPSAWFALRLRLSAHEF